MNHLSEAWHRAIDELVRLGGKEIAAKDVWIVDFDLGVVDADDVLAVIPGEYERRGTLYACDAERAVFRCPEDSKAGQLAVYATEAAYRDALAHA